MGQICRRWILMSFFGLSFGNSAYAEIYKCIHSDASYRIAYVMEVEKITYESSGYHCNPVDVDKKSQSSSSSSEGSQQKLSPGNYIVFQRGNAKVFVKVDSQSTSSTISDKKKLTKEECLNILLPGAGHSACF